MLLPQVGSDLCHRCYGQFQQVVVTGTAQEVMHVEFTAVMFWQLAEYYSNYSKAR